MKKTNINLSILVVTLLSSFSFNRTYSMGILPSDMAFDYAQQVLGEVCSIRSLAIGLSSLAVTRGTYEVCSSLQIKKRPGSYADRLNIAWSIVLPIAMLAHTQIGQPKPLSIMEVLKPLGIVVGSLSGLCFLGYASKWTALVWGRRFNINENHKRSLDYAVRLTKNWIHWPMSAAVGYCMYQRFNQ